MEIERIDSAAVAKLVRQRLKGAFPATRFRVRTRRYAGGSSIDVNWTDGPTGPRVDSEVGHMVAGSFNGMTDSFEFQPASILDGKPVKYGNSYLFTHRALSDGFRIKLARLLLAKWGVPEEDRAGILANPDGWAGVYICGMQSYDFATLVYQISRDRTRL